VGTWFSPILETLVSAFGGLLAFLLAGTFALKALPFSVGRALNAKQNPATAIVFWSILVGLGVIIATAVTPGG
jgi:uncharacterized protein DUF350